MKTIQFSKSGSEEIIEQILSIQDLFPASRLDVSCRWVRRPILAVMRAFERSKHLILSTGLFGHRSVRFHIHSISGFFDSEIHIFWEPNRLHIEFTLQGDKYPIRSLKKEWRREKKAEILNWKRLRSHRLRRRPKWRKFGAHACSVICQMVNMTTISHVMDS